VSSLLETALAYAARGWAVLPLFGIAAGRCTCGQADCASPGKHPRTIHGVKDASREPERIRAWDWAGASIGIATGAVSGLVVLDLDPRHGGFESALTLKEKHGPLPDTLIASTGGSGMHLYFRHPGGRVPNSTSKIAPGIDVRGDGGFVVAPPSGHLSGNAYTWRNGPVGEPQPLPAWLEALIAAKPERSAGNLERFQSGSTTASERWLYEALARATEGNRNDTGLWLACQLRDAGIAEPEAAEVLRQYAARCPAGQTPYSEREALATCRSAYATPPREPAAAPAPVVTRTVVAPPAAAAPLSAGELLDQFPELRPPVIHDLLREAEIMNLIAASKSRKSWLVLNLALSVVAGRAWLRKFVVERGDVLLIDNELHKQTLARRIRTVAEAMGLARHEYAVSLHVEALRGRLQDLFTLRHYFEQLEPRRYRLIVLDAFYRFLPVGTDENDNGAMAHLYNVLDSCAARLECAFVLIHHASKGSQADKSVTDVGAGAGSMARATDTHLILRPHEEDNVVVLDCAARSWPPLAPMCLRWEFPLWHPADSLDPTQLLRASRKRGKAVPPAPEITPAAFVTRYLSAKPQERRAIIARAMVDGLSSRKATGLLSMAVVDEIAHEWRSTNPSEPVRFSTEKNPETEMSRARAHTPHTPRGCADAPRGRAGKARPRARRKGGGE
jgi:hypothetical protein